MTATGERAHGDRFGRDQPVLCAAATSPLVAAALSAATRWHAGQRRAADHAAFIEHPLHVGVDLAGEQRSYAAAATRLYSITRFLRGPM